MEDEKKDRSAPPLDAVLDALGTEGSEALLAELLQGESAPFDPYTTKPAAIRARLKDLAGRRPELIAKIIAYWMREGRRSA